MANITFEIVKDGNVEQCRELCNELMSFQASQGKYHPEILAWMNFDNRLKPSFEGAQTKYLVVMKDAGVPVGYVYAAVDSFVEQARNMLPPWAPTDGEDIKGFFPAWLEAPQKTGGLNNLFVREEYRKTGAGKQLFTMAMGWLESFDEIKYSFVHVSNGNENAYNFYQKHGFKFSHDVAGGFIKCLYKEKA